MAYPPAYERDFSFTDFETSNPGVPKPGPGLDTEFDDVSNALTATQTNLALIQRADGALANGSVGEDQLDPTLFDGIADDAVADAEAAAAAAAASASAAAGSATSASASATSASTSAATASGAAAQAGVSQGIAQTAANDAALSADDADNSADVSVQAANDTAGSVAACEAHVQRAFEWAELLTGPVLPADPGWPEAVDDGMFSSKWWAIRAREYNSTDTIDLGTAGADVGEAFDIWDAIPGNDLGIGQTYATWGDPAQTYVLIDRSNPSDPDSWENITGGPGPPGPPNTLTTGTITTGAPGSSVVVTITGTSPNQVLNMSIPQGDTGATGPIGPVGPPNALAIGTVTTVPDGTPSSATITGTAPTQTLNLTLTAGPQGIQGIQGIQGPVGPAVNLADPTGVIGLTAVNGVATTAPRSDSSPALSQAIAPTWTGFHKFTNPNTLFGTTTSLSVGNTMSVQQFGTTAQASGHSMTRGSADASGVIFALAKTRSTAYNATTPVQSGDVIGQVSWLGADGTSMASAGTMFCIVSGAVSTGVVPGEIRFTTNSTTGVSTERFRLTANGAFGLAGGNYGTAGQVITSAGSAAAPTWTNPALVAANFANPTASLGLAAINGTAITAMRSDAAPALSQAIVPTWTGQHTWTQPLLGPNGTAAFPTYSFTADPDTGIYREDVNTIGISTAGAQRYRLDANQLSGPDGTVGQPAFTFLADNDTGMYRPGPNDIRFVVGGAAIFGVEASQLYGFAPIRSVDGTAALPVFSFLSDNDTGLYRTGADAIGITTGGVTRLAITNTLLSVVLPIYGSDGTAAQPSYSFNSDPDTGMYRAAADAIGIVTGGALRVGISNSNFGLTVPLYGLFGSAAAPGYSFNGDEDTGMWRSSANLIDWSIGGVNTMELTSTTLFGPSFQSSSSRAIKRETGKPSMVRNILARLRPILYRMLVDESKEQLGLIAEEVHEVCPQLSDGKTVSYDRLAILLLAAWQDEHAEAA